MPVQFRRFAARRASCAVGGCLGLILLVSLGVSTARADVDMVAPPALRSSNVVSPDAVSAAGRLQLLGCWGMGYRRELSERLRDR